MSAPTSASDAAAFFDTAVREGMLEAACAKDLKKKLKGSDSSPAQLCIDAGRLRPVQAEAIEGLLRPNSIADGYKVVGLLGYGGIGVVYRARQPALDRTVALKTLCGQRLSASTASARFQQEARAVAKLKHPNIVTAYDYGRCTGDAAEGRFYLAMEFVEGTDLDHLIRERSALSERETWRIVQQVAAALAHAHESGIVHRDIKPANLLMTNPPAGYPLPNGVPMAKVTDFGLVQLRSTEVVDENRANATRLTVTGATMGTPNYMAPEQIDDAHVDHRADIYALGATAYHMLTGRPPYAGQSLMKVITAKLSGDASLLEALPEEVTPPTQELLAAMLAHTPEDRPADYAELLDRIARVLQTDGIDSRLTLMAPPSVVASRSTPSMRADETRLMSPSPAARKVSRRRWLIGSAAVAAAVVGGVVWWSRPRSLPQPRWKASGRQEPLPRKLPPWTTTSNWSPPVADTRLPYFQATPVSGTIRFRLNRAAMWSESGLPEHFGVGLVLYRGSAQMVEVSLAWSDTNESVSVLVSADEIVTGRRRSDGLESNQPPTLVITNAEKATEYRLERDKEAWFAYRSGSLAPFGYAWIRRPELPDTLEITTSGGEAYLSEAWVFDLEPLSGE